MKLYFSPGACSMSTHICLNEAGLNYEALKVNLKTHEFNGSDYYKVNPKGSVPALQNDQGEVLTECSVIMQYIADQKPEAQLMPKFGSFERYRCQEWLNYVATEIHKGFSPLWNPKTPEEFKTMARENLAKKFTYLNNHFMNNTFLMGNQYTVADAYLFTVVNWSKMVGLEMSPYPKLMSFMETVQMRPAVQATLKKEGLI